MACIQPGFHSRYTSMNRKCSALLCCWTLGALLHAEEKPPATPEGALNPHGHAEQGKPGVPGAGPEKKDAKPEEGKGEKKERVSETKHSITLHGQKMDYTATAGLQPLKDAEGKTIAEIFYIAYTKDGATDRAKRPVTFSFNGGPGSSSVWMHMGLLGPKRVKLKENGFALPPPYEMVENEYCLLDETDLIFIDPVGTGYSVADKPEDGKKFWGVKEDAQSVGEFIRLYVTKHDRWLSPKFLIGESYGTTRAAALSGELSRSHRMNLNGIMFLSSVLNFQTIFGGEGNELPHVLYLPSFTATAWYHKKLPADLQALPLPEVLKQSEDFASGEFNQALLLGSAMDKERRALTIKKFSRFTGLSESYVDRANFRVPLQQFAAELLRDQGQVLGRFDGRYTSYVQSALSPYAERDPSADAVFSAFASTFNDYVRTELKFEEDRPYHILAPIGPWNWGAQNQFADVSDTLADTMTSNPFLKVHVSCGYFDLATPYYAAQYQFHHLQLHPALQGNITMDYYTAGHMMYLNQPDLQKQNTDLSKFINTTLAH